MLNLMLLNYKVKLFFIPYSPGKQLDYLLKKDFIRQSLERMDDNNSNRLK